MRTVGRPKKLKAERRGILIPIRVTADELRVIDRAAKAAGLDRSKWARKGLLSLARGVKITEDVGIEPHRRANAES